MAIQGGCDVARRVYVCGRKVLPTGHSYCSAATQCADDGGERCASSAGIIERSGRHGEESGCLRVEGVANQAHRPVSAGTQRGKDDASVGMSKM